MGDNNQQNKEDIMMLLPYHYMSNFKDQKFYNGNYGLWFNKYVPVATKEKNGKVIDVIIGDDEGKKDSRIEYYKKVYDSNEAKINELLKEKHISQFYFYKSLEKIGYKTLVIEAKIKSPLIVGLGETHPSEVSMTFDHNIGVPYIRASSIKGIVRLAHIIELITGNRKIKINGDFVDDENLPGIKDLFGTTSERGKVIFMDAYPLERPKLYVDIMNPHYQEYYSSKESPKPPSDNSLPIPLKFLVIKSEDTTFVFRAIIDRVIIDKKINDNRGLYNYLINVYSRALEIEGIGAKTSLGYGRFKIEKIEDEPERVKKWLKEKEEEILKQEQSMQERLEREKFNNMSEDEKMIYRISKINKNIEQDELLGELANIWNEIKNGKYNKDIYMKFKEKLIEVNEWKPSGSKKRREKMRKRQKEIEEKLNA